MKEGLGGDAVQPPAHHHVLERESEKHGGKAGAAGAVIPKPRRRTFVGSLFWPYVY
jgi:hypothetical protein